MIRNDLDKIRSTTPNIVILELGLNDLIDRDSDPETILLSMVALAEPLPKEFNLRFIAVCEVIARHHEPFVGYIEKTVLMNSHVREVTATLQDRPRADRFSAFVFHINFYKPHIF